MTDIHATYLPFSKEHLLKHFAPVASKGDSERHASHYLRSAAKAAAFAAAAGALPGGPAPSEGTVREALQMQKDERFWVVTALMTIFHEQESLVALLSRALGDVPPFPGFASWAQALGEEPRLYFEVNLPSPSTYKAWLKNHLSQRSLIPYLREPAIESGKRELEKATKADAMIVAPDTGFAVVFEAKVLSDVSTTIRYDAARNQIARTLDVLMDSHPRLDKSLAQRDPERSCFVLLTPRLFQEEPETRLYGHLMNAYQKDDALLGRHLPHRDKSQLAGTSRRLVSRDPALLTSRCCRRAS